MGQIQITINTDNAAFHDDEGELAPALEVARILKDLASELEIKAGWGIEWHVEQPILDVNGNRVGEVYTLDDEEEQNVRANLGLMHALFIALGDKNLSAEEEAGVEISNLDLAVRVAADNGITTAEFVKTLRYSLGEATPFREFDRED